MADDGALLILPANGVDTGKATQLRISTVRGDNQLCGQSASLGKVQARFALGKFRSKDIGTAMHRQIAETRPQLGNDQSVLDNPAELRQADVAGIEGQSVRDTVLPYMHRR